MKRSEAVAEDQDGMRTTMMMIVAVAEEATVVVEEVIAVKEEVHLHLAEEILQEEAEAHVAGAVHQAGEDLQQWIRKSKEELHRKAEEHLMAATEAEAVVVEVTEAATVVVVEAVVADDFLSLQII